MRALVTGAAGFIGSHLVQALASTGHEVRGVDCYTSYYDPALKRRNLEQAAMTGRWEIMESDLRTCDLKPLLEGCDTIFHLAGQPGVRASWADGFRQYVEQNIIVTQRILEAARSLAVPRLIFSSSSSIYGNALRYPTTEEAIPLPHSPYGATKLSCEHLCRLYADNWGLQTVSLRYFTVYGPRQRPDMAFYRLIEAGINGTPFSLFGTGEQIRDFTFVADVVRANILAATTDVAAGTAINVSGGASATMTEVIGKVALLLGRDLSIVREAEQPGDVFRTGGAIRRAEQILAWRPEIDLDLGLSRQVDWQLGRL